MNDADDDFIGFVLGYDPNEIFSSTADFYLIDWKRGDQSGALAGLTISHVVNGSNGNTSDVNGSFWQRPSGEVNLITRAINLDFTGWNVNTEYTFDLVFTPTQIQVLVDDVLEINVTAADFGLAQFDDGAFGFYNYSQANVTYAGIEEGSAAQFIPTPAPFALLGIGFLTLAARRKA